ncbi:MAG: RtcB family protein [Calditrichaceae bacterium]|nr:RtcB family protein [Calditrichaceae bacterium]RQV92317.1 MAG: RtcB family protein [Calditrichota bacterium]
MNFRNHKITRINENLFEIERQGQMRVNGRVYVTESMMNQLIKEAEPLQQIINVAHLPGIKKYSLAMPDIHWGYGFPIGGVAATDWNEGVISPGGVGYDINCGIRLASTNLSFNEIKEKIPELVKQLFRKIPTGIGGSDAIKKLSDTDLKNVMTKGAPWIIARGFGEQQDIPAIEESGNLEGADPEAISSRAKERGRTQLGTLGSGNHFLEIGRVDKLFDEETAGALGIFNDQITIMIHTGSRGFGYQICEDYLKVMGQAARKYKINLPDRQLVSAPIQSEEGRRYISAMAGAANFAWSNRQVITSLAKEVFLRVIGISEQQLNFRLVYDVSHNIAKKEKHLIDGQWETVCVHRKGATRAFGKDNTTLPEQFRKTGQPVLIPGDMGRYSFICIGTQKAEEETFGSTCHGAGRLLSRRQAKRIAGHRDLYKELADKDIVVQARGRATMAEEMPDAYKDVAEVVEIMHQSGISKKIARIKPLGVIKG